MNPHEYGALSLVAVTRLIARHIVEIQDLSDRVERLEAEIARPSKVSS